VPGLRDLDFGRNFVSYVEHLEWPEDVVVEEIPSSALLVLHRLQELRPDKLVIVVATSRAPDPPGLVRRFELNDPPGEHVDRHVGDVRAQEVDLAHTLALARQWGALPETVVIEVEPAETTLGLGFSEEVGASLDRIVALVRDEVGAHPQAVGGGGGGPTSASPRRQEVRQSGARFDQLPPVDDLVVSVRSQPGDPGRRLGGDWCDVVPLPGGWTAVVLGEVLGHGLDAAAVTSRLRTTARAHPALEEQRPGRVLAHLDRVVRDAAMEEDATALCLVIHGRTGRAVVANAGHCPPVLCVPDGPATRCDEGLSPALGGRSDGARPEATISLPPDSLLLVFTGELIGSPDGSPTHHMARFGPMTGWASCHPEALCDDVLTSAQAALPPGGGGSLLAIRRPG
jgi:hydrogenase maturation protease